MKIAISHDFVRHKNGEEQSFSARWTELAANADSAAEFCELAPYPLVAKLSSGIQLGSAGLPRSLGAIKCRIR